MRMPKPHSGSFKKITRLAIIANAFQILCALALLMYAILSASFDLPEQAEIALIAIASAVVVWGAIVDIRDAFLMRRSEQQRRMLEEAYGQLEDLNQTLRRQRHDFKNHLQVVYTLTEMKAYSDAQEYVQRIYEDVQAVGSMIRTAVPAVNALLSAKSADCAEKGICFETDIQSSWEDMPVPGWELCRIIGNLVDNAMDALSEAQNENARIRVSIGESIPSWNLIVENNGPEIPAEHRKSILQPGFTTKSLGHGNGLSIVKELVEKYGGELKFESSCGKTLFSCILPRSDSQSITISKEEQDLRVT